MTHPKKQQKTDRHHGGKRAEIVSKWDSQKSTVRVPKMIKIRKTSRDPKGIQKASKKCPKGVQKASKLRQIRPHWNKNAKIPMQRTAENHASYQSFSSEQKTQHMQSRPQLAPALLTFVSVLLQAFSMSTFHVHAGVQVQFTKNNWATQRPCTLSELLIWTKISAHAKQTSARIWTAHICLSAAFWHASLQHVHVPCRCTGIVQKNQLNHSNTKTCKEPCTPSDLTKRRVTSRCGGVASAFSIIV